MGQRSIEESSLMTAAQQNDLMEKTMDERLRIVKRQVLPASTTVSTGVRETLDADNGR
jgi:hypothetical protein